MKLQRLAGYGPIASFVSAGCLLVFAMFQMVMLPPSLAMVGLIAYIRSMFGWAAGLTITVFDLEWMEHSATRTRWIQAGLVAAVVASVMPFVLLAAQLGQVSIPYVFEVPSALLLGGVGFSVLTHNIEARRVRLLHGALPWIGIVSGACWLYLGLLQFIYMFTPKLLMGFVYGLPVAELIYLVWAIWMGVHLTRAKRAAAVARPVAVSVAAH